MSEFVGSVHDWETLARTFNLKVRVFPTWKGPGTVLLVWSTLGDMPIEGDPMRAINEMVNDFATVATDYTSISVG